MLVHKMHKRLLGLLKYARMFIYTILCILCILIAMFCTFGTSYSPLCLSATPNTSALRYGEVYLCLEIEDDFDILFGRVYSFDSLMWKSIFHQVKDKGWIFFLFLLAVCDECHFLKPLTFVIILTFYLEITIYHKVITTGNTYHHRWKIMK